MNLLFVTTHLPPDNHFGGVVQSGQALISNLKNLLPDVTTCCVSSNPKQVTENNIHHPICTKTFIFHRWGLSPDFAPCFKALAQKADIVVINGIMTYPMTVAGTISKNLGKPYVISLRGGLLPYHMTIKPLRKKLFLRMFVRDILHQASAIHVTSKQEYQCVAKLGLKTPVTIIPNGANLPPDNIDSLQLPSIIESFHNGQRVVLFMGRISPIKGLDILVKSWADLVKERKYSDVRLIVAGPDERGYTEKLKITARKLGVESKILFPGMMDGESKWALYKYADIFILPSYGENFGHVVAEALGCETPAIATTSTPWEKLKTYNAGRWVEPRQQSLTAALRELLDMPRENLERMGKCGRKLIEEQYSWNLITKKLINLYQCIVENKSIPVYYDEGDV